MGEFMLERAKPKQVFALSFAIIMLLALIISPRTVEATQIPFSNTGHLIPYRLVQSQETTGPLVVRRR
jgi:hypothetical protein